MNKIFKFIVQGLLLGSAHQDSWTKYALCLFLYCLRVRNDFLYFYVYIIVHTIFRTSLVAQMIQCLPTMPETRVQSLGQKDPLEKEMATHSSTLAWKTPWMEESGGLQSMGVTKSWTWLSDFTFTYNIYILNVFIDI